MSKNICNPKADCNVCPTCCQDYILNGTACDSCVNQPAPSGCLPGIPVDCKGQWENDYPWSSDKPSVCNCTTAARDTRYRIMTPAAYGGKACPYKNGTKCTPQIITGGCKPIDCKGSWSEGVCDCDHSGSNNVYRVSQPALFGGKPCPYSANDRCSPHGCPPTTISALLTCTPTLSASCSSGGKYTSIRTPKGQNLGFCCALQLK